MWTRSLATAERQRVRQLHTSFSGRSLIVHFTEHRICCTAINYNRLAKLVSTLGYQLTNRATYVADKAFKHLYTFKVICFCIIWKPLSAFIIIHIPNGHTSQDVWKMLLQVWRRPGKKRRFVLPETRVNDLYFLPLIVLVYVYYFSCNYL